MPTSRWSLLQTADGAEDPVAARASQLLRRYGIVFPEMLAREPQAPSWRALLQVYRRAEARGEIRGGRFVAGFVGEQYALPEAVDAMRRLRRADPDGEVTVVSACDPLNVVGVLTPGRRVPALLGNRVAFRDGIPLASIQSDQVEFHTETDEGTRSEVAALLRESRATAGNTLPN